MLTYISAGHEIVGGTVSVMVTEKVQVPVLPLTSVAVTVTIVVPTLNVDPLAGLKMIVLIPQLSVAVAV